MTCELGPRFVQGSIPSGTASMRREEEAENAHEPVEHRHWQFHVCHPLPQALLDPAMGTGECPFNMEAHGTYLLGQLLLLHFIL